MLELKNIKKNYILKGQEPVHALRGISLAFRNSEFVSVLGPSGCGKTTLLNIIGGLDRYTSGDLFIQGVSTKKYKDADWDTYRNHSVGFVFQSYNLIGHQSIVKNVELALTIAGLSKNERRERALEALGKVGLKKQAKKRPNQLSGGQMQRVAIARALVNNPEILLADEPTGALDSVTSTQIMDLLKEVAKDRLVIMVTHNPDLAYKYSNRIVKMFDGEIVDDSNPYTPNNKEIEEARKSHTEVVTTKGSKKHSSMGFFTALGLSTSNLLSKSKRTVLVAVAGSIGIFGVSTVLAASTGVHHYIDTMQDDMLSSYPLTIAEESVDYTSLMTGLYSDTDSKIADFDTSTKVGLNSMIDYLMDKYTDVMSVKTNTINQDLVDFVKDMPKEFVSAISFSYGIDPTNNIFTEWSVKNPEVGHENDPARDVKISLNGLTQRYISELQTVEGFEQYARYVDLFTDFMLLLPGEQDYILSQYDLLGKDAHFPRNENEIMLVVEGDTTLTDLAFAQLGYYEENEVMNIAKKAILKYDENTTKEELDTLDERFPYRTEFTFDDLMKKTFTYYPHNTIYGTAPKDLADSSYNEYNLVLRTPANDEFYAITYSDNSSSLIKGIIYTGTHLKINPNFSESVYLVKMNDSFDVAAAMAGEANFSDFLADPETDLDPTSGTFICIPASKALSVMTNRGGLTPEDLAALSLVTIQSGDETNAYVTSVASPTPKAFLCNKEKTEQTAINAYQYTAEASDSWENGTELTIAGILRPKKGVSFGCLRRGVYYTKEFQAKFMRDAKEAAITKNFEDFLELGAGKSSMYQAYVTFTYPNYSDPDNPFMDTGYASCLNGDLNSSFSTLFSSITGTDYEGENETHFRSICGLKQVASTNEQGDVTGYTYEELPEKMSIYPVNFKFKDKVTKYLDNWNKSGDITLSNGNVIKQNARDELTYTDTISLIIGVINTMINIVTTALIIFTSLSLVVSSFMIAVITYISVMERVKEIGVIRSLGGRKKDVSRLFIAENLVTGLMSGLIGIAITAIACLIINLVVSPFGIPAIGLLTPTIILVMIGLSVLLSVLAGLIPSMHASRQDPVAALRSE